MACFKARKVKQSLAKKGFEEESSDHYYFVLCENGKKTRVYTKTSRNNQDIDDPLISLMSQQLHLTKRQFMDLINCPLSKEEYIKILKNKNII